MEIDLDYHITEVIINKRFDEVWNWVSNPLNYSKIYPNWIQDIKLINPNVFEVSCVPDGFKQILSVDLNRDTGVIDLNISPGEISKSRLIQIGENKTLHLHIAVKGSQSDELFQLIAESTDKDFLNEKKIIENNY